MNLLAITKHSDLVERLRTAFEGAGHRVHWVKDHLEALAGEAWNDAHILLVDVAGDPLDGIRFCNLLRKEVRLLFHNLPIFLVLDHPVTESDAIDFQEVDADGLVYAGDSMHRLLHVLGPATEGNSARSDAPKVPILATGLSRTILKRVNTLFEHFGFQLQTCSEKDLVDRQRDLKAPILLLGLDTEGTRTLSVIQQLRDHEDSPYVILIGNTQREALQRKILMAGTMDWVPLPLSAPRLLHACRKALEWIHIKRVQQEYQFQINDLRERRQMLELETSTLRSEVLTDPMTGLLNRRAFNQNLEHAFNQWQRHHRPFVLILGDLDYFKLINDRFGHLIGDQVLEILGERMHHSLRRSDLAFRIGGEEFAIILMETNLHAGAEVADKLRRKIDANPIHLEGGQTIFPTMSFGVGAPSGRSAESLFSAVDEALYIAKHKGRNRIEVVPEVLDANASSAN